MCNCGPAAQLVVGGAAVWTVCCCCADGRSQAAQRWQLLIPAASAWCRWSHLAQHVGAAGWRHVAREHRASCFAPLHGAQCRKPTPNPAPHSVYCEWVPLAALPLPVAQRHMGIMHRPGRPDHAHAALQPQIVQLLVQPQLRVRY